MFRANVFETPTSAEQIVRCLQDMGRCIVTVKPLREGRIVYPRDVDKCRMDRNGEWWFGVQLFAYQWFQFPSVGLEWRLVRSGEETDVKPVPLR